LCLSEVRISKADAARALVAPEAQAIVLPPAKKTTARRD